MKYSNICKPLLEMVLGAILVIYSAVSSSADGGLALEQRVDELLTQLTLEEKVSLLAGKNYWSTQPVPRLGIPSIKLADGPNGVRSNNSDPTTAFPAGVAVAASWENNQVKAMGAAIAREVRANDYQVLLGPMINIQRTPLAGRNFETFSEDPFLTGEIGAAYIQGVQSEGIAATPKHFVVHNQSNMRMYGSADVEEQPLQEIYLSGFKRAIDKGKPWALMSAYNKVNGIYMSHHKALLNGVLRDQWAYDGVVMSDWEALHETKAGIEAGMDLEMPGPAHYYGEKLLLAVKAGRVSETVVDDSVRRILRLVLRTGLMDGKPLFVGELNSEGHRNIARRMAEQGIVLLKNEHQVLPIKRGDLKGGNLKGDNLKRIAVIGPNADAQVFQGGGSAMVTPNRIVTTYEGVVAAAGDKFDVHYAQGVDNNIYAPQIDTRLLKVSDDGKLNGLTARYYANDQFRGEAVKVAREEHFYRLGFAVDIPRDSAKRFSVRWDGYFYAPRSGSYEFSLVHDSSARLVIDGNALITDETPSTESPVLGFLPIRMRTAKVELQAGHSYRILMEYASGDFSESIFRLGAKVPEEGIDKAVEIAKKADIAVVVVGSSNTSETETSDRTSLELYGRQNELITAIAAVNPRTVVVLINGAPVTMPWLDKVDAVVETWLPGQEGGHAIANVLFGKVNPSGKLPISFPRQLEDNPTFKHSSGGDNVRYGEGLLVGYRYYDKKNIQPLFPFGHGLSYTTFNYKHLKLPKRVTFGESFAVTVDIENTGVHDGQEVVQLYVENIASTALTAIKELKGFDKVMLKPGERKTVGFELTPQDLSFYDPNIKDWVEPTGSFRVLVGSSSRDLKVAGVIEVVKSDENNVSKLYESTNE